MGLTQNDQSFGMTFEMAYKLPKEAGAVCPGLFWLANRTHIKKILTR
jgi:hypothetical protein